MRPIDEIRHERLLELIREAGSVQALADALGKSHSQISQLKTRARYNESGGRKSVGTTLAREIETKLGKPAGWMDTEPRAASVAVELPARQPLSPQSRQAAWRAAAGRLAELTAQRGMPLDAETFALFVDAAIDELDQEISEEAAEQVFKRWLPVIARGRAVNHA